MAEPVPPGYAFDWQAVTNIQSQEFTCWHCGNIVASDKGWAALSTFTRNLCGFVCICHRCKRPTFIDDFDNQHPSPVFGNAVSDIPDVTVTHLYDEARRCIGADAYTAAVLACRKLLMHIAVSKGAPLGQSFVTYVEYLADHNYIAPDAKGWVDHIRQKSNEANHEIVIMKREDAEQLVTFSEMLLKVIFQFPAAIQKKKKP